MAQVVQLPAGHKWWNGGKSPFNLEYGKVMMWYFLMSDAFTFGAFLISYGTIRFSRDFWPDPNKVFNAVPGFHGANLPLVFVSIMTFILIVSSVTMVMAVQDGHNNNRKGVIKNLWLTIIFGAMFLGCQALEWQHLLTGEHLVLTKDGTLTLLTQTMRSNPWGPEVSPEALSAALSKTSQEELFNIANMLSHEHHGSHEVAIKASMTANELIPIIKSHSVHANESGAIAFGGYFYGITGFHGFHVFSGLVINIIMLIMTYKGVFDRKGHYNMIEKAGLYWHFVDLVWVFVFLCFYLI
jgi:cytochrome c oxidase subunit III